MANAAASAANACVFRWDIYDPFIRWRQFEATFYQGSPAVTQWRAVLLPMDSTNSSSIDNWEFLFSVEFVKTLDSRLEIVADRLQVKIMLNGTVITDEKVPNQCFYKNYVIMYRLWRKASISPQAEPHHLEVAIEISLSGQTKEKAGGNGLFFHEDDLRSLSRDLGLLRTDPRFCNLKLIPRNSQEPINTHPYIIDARWSNFFQVHRFQEGRVQTYISREVLTDIITYMYSGTVSQSWLDWSNPAYTTELLTVIDRYKLYHLYKVFVKSDLQQLRVTRTPVSDQNHLCQLNFINGRQITDTTHTWRVENNPGLTFIFIIRNENKTGPWLSYKLESTYSSRVYAKVNLKFLCMENNVFQTPSSFYVDDFVINQDSCAGENRVLFLGCPETFGRVYGTEIKYFIQCCLSFNNGSINERIRCVDDDTLLNDVARFDILSDHMRQLRKNAAYNDMTIEIRSEGDDVSIHKGIFAIRVPEWRNGLDNVMSANDLPKTTTSTLGDDALTIVLDYIYTGKIFTHPSPDILDEIELFAEETQFASLLDLVNRIRLQ